MVFEGVWKDEQREELRRLLDWPDDTADRVERESWEDTQRSLANMGIELDWDAWERMQGELAVDGDTEAVHDPTAEV